MRSLLKERNYKNMAEDTSNNDFTESGSNGIEIVTITKPVAEYGDSITIITSYEKVVN